MPKRKATTSLDMNGDEGSDEGIGNESDVAIAKRMHPSDVSTTKFGGKETEGLKYFADELGVHFKSLNQNFVASIRQAVEKDPSMCLVPIAQDYVTHCKGLLKKHQKNSSNVPSSSVLPLDNTEEFLKMEKFLREQKSQGTTLPINAAQQLPKFSEPILNGATTASGFSTKKFGGFEFGGSKPAAGPASTMSSGLNTSSGGFQFGSKVASESSPGRIGGFDFGPKPAGVGSSANSPNRGFEFNNSKPEVGGIGTLGSNANSGLGFGQFSPKVPLGVSKSGGSSGFEFNMRKTDTDLSGSAMTSGSSASMSGGFELNTKTGGFGSSSGSSASSGTGFQFTFNKPSVPQTSRVDSPDSTPAAGETDEQKEEESDEPPKNEFKPVVEDDALYSVRCKVFGMQKGGFKDKGVGQLFIKKLDTEKYQVVVRADNNLGTILLNILLKEELPLKKKSAKDVLTVDPIGDGGKPLTILIRVKDEALANELLEKLQHYAKQSNDNS